MAPELRTAKHDAPRLARRIDDDAPAREPLAGVIVGLAFELEGDAAREPGAEALARGALEFHVDGAVGQPFVAVDLGDLAREHGAGGAVGIADRRLDPDLGAAVDRGARLDDQLAVEHLGDAVVLRLAFVDLHARSRRRLGEQF